MSLLEEDVRIGAGLIIISCACDGVVRGYPGDSPVAAAARVDRVPASVLVFAVRAGVRWSSPPGLLTVVAITGGIIGTVAAVPMIVVGLFEESAELQVAKPIPLATPMTTPAR